MTRNGDSHPAPDDPNIGPVPHFPPGTAKPQTGVELERPGERNEVPGEDYPPERKPFPDTVPDPGIEHS